MSRVVGIDMRDNHVRVAALKGGYRKIEFEGFEEELLSVHESPSAALKACLSRLAAGGFDTAVATVDGARCFNHVVQLPESARKRLTELLPFELEAELPIDIEELVIDSAIVGEQVDLDGTKEISVLSVAARREDVQAVIDFVREATQKQPERVGSSTSELEQLVHLNPALRGEEPIALVDFGFTRTDICIVQGGRLQLARALSLGVDGFPNDAPNCIARLRQTLAAHATSTGQEVARLYVLGEGASMQGLPEYLAGQLGMIVEIFDRVELEGLPPDQEERIPQFGRALSIAMHGVRGRGLDLRQGELSFERGYENVKERAPLLAGLLAAVLLSFFFSVWAESRALAAEHDALLTSLGEVSKSTFGVETSDPDQVEIELEKARKARPEDPMSYLDGFGVAVVLSETLPESVVHDVEEFDVVKGKVKIRGLVQSANDAQTVAKEFGKHRCIQEPSVTKITQVVNTDRERYTLEADVICPEDEGATKKAKPEGEGQGQSEASE